MYKNFEEKGHLKKNFQEENETGVSDLPDDLQLTARELEVLQHIAEGLTSQKIADRLFVCLDTIETHRKNIIRKFGVKNIAHALAYAFRNNLLE